MTDKELLLDCQTKLDALTPRVDALEAAASGAVSHEEVQAVVDAENTLEARVSNLESVFGAPELTLVPAPVDGGEVNTNNELPESHVIT